MKHLNDYIEQRIKEITTHEFLNYDALDDLDHIVLEHCHIHYKFNYKLPPEYDIDESDGAFPGEHEIIKEICLEVDKNYKSKSTFVFEFNNHIVNKIHVYLYKNEEDDINGGYVYDNNDYEDYNEVRWDKEKKCFKWAEIQIFNYELNPKGLEEILYHELKHLWDDYIEISKKGKFLSDKIEKSFKKKFENTNIDETIKLFFYYVDDFEISAYIAQLNGIFGNKSYDTIGDAFNQVIKKSSIYSNYKYLYTIIHNDELFEKLKKYLSNKELSKIRKNIDEGWKKIINHTYLICGKHISDTRERCTRRKIRLENWRSELSFNKDMKILYEVLQKHENFM